MAVLTARDLRGGVREAMLEAGLRGFVRFAPEGDDALLLTDTLMRGAADGERFVRALEARGYAAAMRPTGGGLLAVTPDEALLLRLAEGARMPSGWDWDGALSPAFSLACRWMRARDAAIGPEGMRLMIETARLLWRPERQVLAGLEGLRARAAVMQRRGAIGGLRACGGMLANWLEDVA